MTCEMVFRCVVNIRLISCCSDSLGAFIPLQCPSLKYAIHHDLLFREPVLSSSTEVDEFEIGLNGDDTPHPGRSINTHWPW